MIAPIREPRPPSAGESARTDLRRARRWMRRTLLDDPPPRSPASPFAAAKAWSAALWIAIVAGAYLWHMLGDRLFNR